MSLGIKKCRPDCIFQDIEVDEIQVKRYNSSFIPKETFRDNLEYTSSKDESYTSDGDFEMNEIDDEYSNIKLIEDNIKLPNIIQNNTIEKMLERAVNNIAKPKVNKKMFKNKNKNSFSSKRNLKWTKEEDDLLTDLVDKYQGKCWKKSKLSHSRKISNTMPSSMDKNFKTRTN